jgi:phage-related holin
MRLVHDDGIRLASVLASPFRRLLETPEAGALTALVVALWQWITGEPFHAALALVLVTACVDYMAGTVTAHVLGEYKSGIAYTGFLSKLLGLVLVLMVRALEGFIAITGFIDSNGAIATAAAVSLIAVDIVSIAKHRQRLGGEPIPFITALTDWIQTSILEKLPGKRPKGDNAP